MSLYLNKLRLQTLSLYCHNFHCPYKRGVKSCAQKIQVIMSLAAPTPDLRSFLMSLLNMDRDSIMSNTTFSRQYRDDHW